MEWWYLWEEDIMKDGSFLRRECDTAAVEEKYDDLEQIGKDEQCIPARTRKPTRTTATCSNEYHSVGSDIPL